MGNIKVYTDGASRGNPGESSIGIVIYDGNDNLLTAHKEYLGNATNNQAEYKALIKSIELINKLEKEFDRIEFYADSELMVKQVNGDYKIKNKELALLNNTFHASIRKTGKRYTINHIERAKNSTADKLANEAIDEQLKKP